MGVGENIEVLRNSILHLGRGPADIVAPGGAAAGPSAPAAAASLLSCSRAFLYPAARQHAAGAVAAPVAVVPSAAVGTAGAATALSYTEIPVATRSWLTASFLLSVLGTGERPLVPPEALCMHWGRAGRALELWRPLTAALFQGPFSFSTLTRIYASYVALRQLETTERQALLHQPCSDVKALSPRRQQLLQQQQQKLLQQQRELQHQWKDPKAFAAAAASASGTAHLFQFLAVECLLLAAAGSALGMPFYGSPLTAAATYVISKTNPEKKAPLPLGLQVPQKVLPFALAALDAVQQQSLQGAVPALLGIATGHIFYLLKKVVPAKTGIQMLPFPSLTYRLLLQKQVRDAAGSSSAAAARISSKFLR
ncbi:derlin-1.2 [Cyclospora cayetanensis]|uniref:Derlin n=1 Tax=Cyclospora cayetanensis TaxID=88456 RepID=A0A6P6S1U7_9EIME|nr:derlin-1.2 [Cyclospora cayetanensis]